MKESLFVLAFFVVGFGVGVGGFFALEAKTCAVQADGLGLNNKYSFFAGCQYEVAGRLVPDDMIRITDTGHVIIQGED